MKYKVIKTCQKECALYTFSISAKKLLEYVHFSSRFDDQKAGIQRAHNAGKSRMIASSIEQGDYSIPNSIIVNLDLEGNKLEASKVFVDGYIDFDYIDAVMGEEKTNLAFVIDGQHRLRAFDYTENDYDVIVTAYADLKISDIANLFVQINYYQKPVDKSLVFDLLGINEKIFPEYVKYHRVIESLNEDINSALYKKIKMLGVGEGIISQASMLSAFEKYQVWKKLENCIDGLSEDIFKALLNNYFAAIIGLYEEEWRRENTILTKSIGLRTMIRIMPDFVRKMLFDRKMDSLNSEEFLVILSELDEKVKKDIYERYNQKENSVWTYFTRMGIGGESGISMLYKYFYKLLMEE